MFETIVAVVGSVVTEPRVRETSGGDRVASFRVLSTARRFDRQAQRWVDGDRFFATVNCWRHLAEGVARDVQKRNRVVVSGRLRTREYESGGQWRSVVEIEANAVGLDIGRRAREDAAVGAVSPVVGAVVGAEPARAEPGEAGPEVTAPRAAGPDLAGPDLAGPEEVGPDAGCSIGAGAGMAGAEMAGEGRATTRMTRRHEAGPNKTGPDKTGPDKTGPDKTGPDKIGQEKAGPEQADPDKADPRRPGSGPEVDFPGSRAEVAAGCASVPSG